MKWTVSPLAILLMVLSNIMFAQNTNIQASNTEKIGCELTVRDLTKHVTYSAKTADYQTSSWLLVRVNGDEPSKSQQGKFRGITNNFNSALNTFSNGDLPSSLRISGKSYVMKFIENGNYDRPVKAVYSTQSANSVYSKFVVHFDPYYSYSSRVEKMELQKVNTRNSAVETQLVLSFFNYSK